MQVHNSKGLRKNCKYVLMLYLLPLYDLCALSSDYDKLTALKYFIIIFKQDELSNTAFLR